MQPALPVLLCSFTLWTCRALEISHQDLEDPNGKLCGRNGWCDEKTNRTDDLRTRNCMCDEKCDKYGDCCLNSQYFNAAQQRRAASSFKCQSVENNDHVYTKVDCPPLWRNADVRRKCERSAAGSADDPLLMTPVTSRTTNVTYGNIYCAVCNRDRDQVAYWKLKLECERNGTRLTGSYGDDFVDRNLSFNNRLNYWQLRVADDEYYECELILSVEPSVAQRVRRCRPTMKTCPATWGKDEIRQRCESYTLMVHRNATTASESYRNVHCAICNSVPVQSVGCQPSPYSLTDVLFKIESFTILFDFNGGRQVGHAAAANCTGKHRVYDRFFRRCRNVDAAAAAAASETDTDVDGERDRTLRETLNCSSVLSERTNDTARNVYPLAYDKLSRADDDDDDDNDNADDADDVATLQLCQEYYATDAAAAAAAADRGTAAAADDSRRRVITYRPYYSVLTLAGVGVSIVCLCAHLVVFAVVKELRNLSGKNLASFCVALLLAYCSFTLVDVLDGKLCFANAIGTYYFFMAAFTWMLAMSFDVWRTLRIATKELRVSSGKQWRKFFVYSFCGWVLPAKLALIAVLVDLCPSTIVSDRYRPHFGVRSCWFGQGPPMLVFFGLPIFLILVCNLVFFLSSAYMIYSSHSMTRYSASPATKRDFRLYARLALLMGLTWIFGLLAAYANNEIVWLIFILSNTTLGLFVFVAFTCRSKVLRALRNLKRDSVLNLPAFSWSLNPSEMDDKSHVRSSSSADSGDGASGKQPTSNTYY